MRMPISRVRSVTDTSMMFIIPTPPTTSEMAAMPVSIAASLPMIVVNTAATSAVLRTSKSGFSPGGMRWRSFSSERISFSALKDNVSLRAEMQLRSTLLNPVFCSRFLTVVNGISKTLSWSRPPRSAPLRASKPMTLKGMFFNPHLLADRVGVREELPGHSVAEHAHLGRRGDLAA